MKLISKNNVSGALTLLLIILLSQSHILDFLIDTALGRVILLSSLLFVAGNNKILGLIIVLAIIIFFNYNYVEDNNRGIEGFEDKTSGKDGEKKKPEDKKPEDKKAAEKKDVAEPDAIDANAKKTVDKSSNEDKSTAPEFDLVKNIKTEKPAEGREGFCMSDRESNILRGKRPNSIPVFSNLRKQPDDVSPYDESAFVSDYAAF